jgi:uncharacterized membrane protein YeiH
LIVSAQVVQAAMLSAAYNVVDLMAVAVFAVTGALVASRKQLDIFGFIMLGTATGIGGSTISDLLLGLTPVSWVRDPASVLVCVVASVLVYFSAHLVYSRYKWILWLDALGLSLGAVAGAEKGLDVGAGGLVAVVMGVITAAFGGVVRDVLGHEPSLILRREIYMTAAMAGAAGFVALASLGMSRTLAGCIGFAVCLSVRLLALTFHWSLPTYRARPGREPDELGL